MKIGFDVHGVLDTFPFFAELTKVLVDAGHEVHIVTGLQHKSIVDELDGVDFKFTHFFSIVDHLMERNVEIEWRDGLPFADDKVWDEAKSLYCESRGIDFLLDDSQKYGKFFENMETVYCQVHNKDRKIYEVR
jgi:hypothetical protein